MRQGGEPEPEPAREYGATPPLAMALNSTIPTPTDRNRDNVISYVVRQGERNQARGDWGLTNWCYKRELAYWEAYNWPDPLSTYASARDCACWQRVCSEPELWMLLEAFDEAR